MSGSPWEAVGAAAGNFLGGAFDREHNSNQSERDFNRNYAMQKEFAKNALSWRVQDARKAGLHPLAALGAQIGGASPIMNTLPGSNMSGAISSATSAYLASKQSDQAAKQLEQDRLESQSRVELNNAQRDLIQQQAADSLLARVTQGATPSLKEDVKLPQRTSHVNAGFTVPTNPKFSDAQTYEDRYGEVGGALMGLFNLPMDALQALINHVRSTYQGDHPARPGYNLSPEQRQEMFGGK